MAHWETGSGRINDLRGFSDACQQHEVMGLVDAVSSLGIEDFAIDDFPGVAGWASCPQKGVLCLPLTYAPVSLTDRYIDHLRANGCYSFVHHPVMEARHWAIIDGKDTAAGSYHRTHSGYAVAAFHEALRINLQHGHAQKARDYAYHEAALRSAVQALGCEVTSNMTSLVVLNLPASLAGREKELVQACRAKGFGIWPTLSEPVQVRIGILNQLSEAAITEIVTRFADRDERDGRQGRSGCGRCRVETPLPRGHRSRIGAAEFRKREASMDIHEYQAKEILAKFGVAVPEGGLAYSPEQAAYRARELGGTAGSSRRRSMPGARGKAGGVKLCNSEHEIQEATNAMFGQKLVTHQTGPEGKGIYRVYVEAAVDFTREIYLGLVLDRTSQRVMIVASSEGGMEIEEISASRSPLRSCGPPWNRPWACRNSRRARLPLRWASPPR